MQRTPLNTGWHFVNANDISDVKRTVAQFPTVVHLDLLHHGLIPDPELDLNREACQWVGETTWRYSTSFNYGWSGHEHVDVVFEGLDTFASIKLNGTEILQTDNMFVEYRVDVKKVLKEHNELEIEFKSAFLGGRRLEKEQGFKNLFWNGDSSRLNVRKVACHYGWDWGPRMMTAGPYKPIYLEAYDTRITDLVIDIEVSDTLDSALVTLEVEVQGLKDKYIEITVQDPEGRILETYQFDDQSRSSSTNGSERKVHVLSIDKPRLWYPAGYGAQELYTFSASVHKGDHKIDTRTEKIGIRKLEVIQRPLLARPSDANSEELIRPKGTTFFFHINNIPIYAQGTNWIPPDTFLPRFTTEKYRTALADHAIGSNHNMIRVWGGGFYESDDFYTLCDELGILIWQDFMFGCGSYPVNDSLLATVEEELRQNIRRLRHHPCMALWCGNNEDYMFAEIHKLAYDPLDNDPQSWLKSDFAARYYYEDMMPRICAQEAPRIPYHPSSPFSPPSYDTLPPKLSNSTLTGDTHAWRVWMADQPRLPYQDYGSISGRFVSEFGMKSHPALRTLTERITSKDQQYPQSRIMDAWHMAPEDQRTLSLYLNENFRHGTSLEAYVYATQLLQAEAMDFAVRAFRRNWRGQGHEECAGNLIWQLNDCYPAVSWSLVDAAGRKKPAWYAVKRAYESVTVNAELFEKETRKEGADEFSDVDVIKEQGVRVWASNLSLRSLDAVLRLRTISLSGETLHQSSMPVKLLPNRSQQLTTISPVPRLEANATNPNQFIISATLHSTSNTKDSETMLARFILWPQPLKYLDLGTGNIKITPLDMSSKEGDEATMHKSMTKFRLTTDVPVKAVDLYSKVEGEFEFDDNSLDLVPEETDDDGTGGIVVNVVKGEVKNVEDIGVRHLALWQ